MNPDLSRLQPYPFEKLAQLKAGTTPPAGVAHIALSIGEPRHPTPSFIAEEWMNQRQGLGRYPATRGTAELRQAIVDWLSQRFRLPTGHLDPERHVLPVNGTREALFAFAQCVIDRSQDPCVVLPNPFYQIYEGAALLAGATPWYVNTPEATNFIPNFAAVPEKIWQQCQLLYLCSPGNPTGAVIDGPTLESLIELADHYDFVIAADECYSEIYLDEAAPPPGLLEVAAHRGREDFRRCVVFHSLSKRSSAPGLRSGFVAGDARLIEEFYLYRTYHGCALSPPVQAASLKAWGDEDHVRENRSQYRKKFAAVLDILGDVLKCQRPPAGFYLWPKTPFDDTQFARELFARYNVTVLPGSFLSRTVNGENPGERRIRMALVPSMEECVEAAHRIRDFVLQYR